MRAVANNREAAELVGIPTTRLLAISVGVGVALAGVSGMLIGTLFPFTILSGDGYQLKSFVVTVLGGFGNPVGALLGGVALGLLEGLVTPFVPVSWTLVIEFVLFVLVLIAFPGGIFASQARSALDAAAAVLLDHRARYRRLRGGAAIGNNVELRESLSLAAVYITLARNLNLMLGYAGYINFGSIVFFGLGGYICVWLVSSYAWPLAASLLAAGARRLRVVVLFGARHSAVARRRSSRWRPSASSRACRLSSRISRRGAARRASISRSTMFLPLGGSRGRCG